MNRPDDTVVDIRTPEPQRPEAQHIPLDLILPSPYQPRLRKLAKGELAELMESIRGNGQISPIIVTPADDENAGRFYVHSGHRRCEALRLLKTATVLAVVRRDLDQRGMQRLALADNLGREDLTVCEQAKALKNYCDAYEIGAQAAGEELGINRSVAFRLNTIARSSDRLLELFADKRFSVRTAEMLAKLAQQDEKRAVRLAEKFLAGKLTATGLDEAVKASKGSKKAATAVGDDVTLSVAKGRVRLTLNVVTDACTDGQRERVRHALAQAMAHLGIDSIDARAVERRAE